MQSGEFAQRLQATSSQFRLIPDWVSLESFYPIDLSYEYDLTRGVGRLASSQAARATPMTARFVNADRRDIP
jgi:hypothetical protein